mmetsp:Transcript_9710/g.21644  ORF Transcript_9710/g.21644 Transcript_9710/m.21644 type:complete len:208 (-) Transcript_9710:580-1203(-)
MTCLQQRGERQRGGVAVLVRQQRLHVAVAPRCSLRPGLCQRVEGADGTKTHHRFGGRQEDLQDGSGVGHVVAQHSMTTGALSIQSCQLAKRPRCLVRDHFTLVTEATVQVGHQGPLHRGITLRHQRLCGVSHQEALGHGTFEAVPGHGGHNFVQRQAIAFLQLVQQRQRMKLHHAMLGVHRLLDLIDPALHDIRHSGVQGHSTDQRR